MIIQEMINISSEISGWKLYLHRALLTVHGFAYKRINPDNLPGSIRSYKLVISPILLVDCHLSLSIGKHEAIWLFR